MNKKLIDFEAALIHQTDDAYLLQIDGLDENHWFPKSLTEDNDDGTWTVPGWLIEAKELENVIT